MRFSDRLCCGPIINRICVIVVISATTAAHADWLSLSGAENSPSIIELHVEADRVRLILEIFKTDRAGFRDLLPEEFTESDVPSANIQPLRVLTPEAGTLTGEVVVAELRERIDRASPFRNLVDPSRIPFSRPPEDPTVVYLEVVYPLTARPQEITVIPPLKPSGYPSATLGFIVFHQTVPVIDFRYLSGAETLRLDWSDPWYSRFDNPNLRRHHEAALMSFLYVEPYEVRHEVLIRIKDLRNRIPLGLRGEEFVEVDELDELQQRVGDYLLQRNPVRIDGQEARPILDRINFVSVGLTGIQVIEQPQRLALNTAILGVIVAYLTEGLPQEVTLHWDLFDEQNQQIPATATDPAGPFASFLTPADPLLRWTNFLNNYESPMVRQVGVTSTSVEIPAATVIAALLVLVAAWNWRRRLERTRIAVLIALILCGGLLYPYARIGVGTGMPSDSDSEAIHQVVSSLLENAYRAFEFRREEDVYDKLALTVSGDLLADVYLQHRRAMEIENQGGARARVKSVEVLSVEPAGRDATYRCIWIAGGSVGHWGHVHYRRNRYEAMLTIEPSNGVWKLAGMELLEERRLDDRT